MTQTIAEAKTGVTPPLDTNAQGEPTVAENEPISNATAAAEAVKIEESLTANAIKDAAAEVTLEASFPDIKAAEANDAAHIERLDEQVAEVEVEQTGEHLDAKQTMHELNGTGASVVGETHPATDLGQTVGTFNQPATQKPDVLSGLIPDFNASRSGKFANPDTNGPALNAAEQEKGKILRFPFLKNLLAGRKAA